MSEPRFTDTNAADDSAGRVFGLEGNLYLPAVVGVVTGVVLFAGLGFAGAPYPVAGTVGVLPVVGTFVWVLGFRHGKPAGHDRDRWDEFFGGGSFTRPDISKTHTKAHFDAPDGRFVNGLLLFGAPERGGVVAKGFRLEPPDLRGASFERLNAFQDQVRNLLGMIAPGRRLQVQWWPDADYRQALLAYHARTQAVTDPLLRSVRNQRFTRYWPRTQNGTLRREHLALFLSVEIDAYAGNLRGREGLHGHYDALLRELAAQFEEFANTLRTVFGPEAPVRPMDDAGHAACLRRFLNPSHARRTADEGPAPFDPALTIQENCWQGEGVGQPGGGFFLDGHHHAVLALRFGV